MSYIFTSQVGAAGPWQGGVGKEAVLTFCPSDEREEGQDQRPAGRAATSPADWWKAQRQGGETEVSSGSVWANRFVFSFFFNLGLCYLRVSTLSSWVALTQPKVAAVKSKANGQQRWVWPAVNQLRGEPTELPLWLGLMSHVMSLRSSSCLNSEFRARASDISKPLSPLCTF